MSCSISAFHGDSHKPAPLTWLAPTFNSVWDNLIALRQFNIDQGIPLDANRSHEQRHQCARCPARSQLRHQREDARRLRTAQLQFPHRSDHRRRPAWPSPGRNQRQDRGHADGAAASPAAHSTPITVSNKYTTWLPNLNLNIHFSPQWQLRLAATKTITRPLFEQLNPALNLGIVPNCDPTRPDCFITGSGGNPFLKPLKSNNYDASLEYYFSASGFASVAAFQRDMKGFIVNRTFRYPNPDPASGIPIEITGPVNTDKGRIKGFEAQVSTFFDADWVPNWAHALRCPSQRHLISTQKPTLRSPATRPGCVSPTCPNGPTIWSRCMRRTA